MEPTALTMLEVVLGNYHNLQEYALLAEEMVDIETITKGQPSASVLQAALVIALGTGTAAALLEALTIALPMFGLDTPDGHAVADVAEAWKDLGSSLLLEFTRAVAREALAGATAEEICDHTADLAAGMASLAK